MNQLNQSGSFTKSASAFSPTKPSPPTYNGYAHFAKFNIPQLSDSSSFIRPPHMQDPQYLKHHATKPATDIKVITINDLEEGVKLSILSDIERDQRLIAVKEKIEEDHRQFAEMDRKRKADHSVFDKFVKESGDKLSDLQIKYNELFGRYTKLQKSYAALDDEHTNDELKNEANMFEIKRLQTLLDIKCQEVEDLNESLLLYVPRSPPNVDALVDIMNQPDLDLKRSANDDDFNDFTHSENPFIDSNQEDLPISAFPSSQLAQTDNITQRVYTKKAIKVVTNPVVLHALHAMARGARPYARHLFQGVDFNGVRYAFYFGRINTGATIGLNTNIILSSEQKVYNVSNIDAIVEMPWNQDIASRGKKRGYGHIYFGTATGSKGFETNLKDAFMTELGVMI